MICISGTPTIMPKVTRSRDSCRTSLSATARMRRRAAVNFSAAMIVPGRNYEHILEAGMRARELPLDSLLLQQRAQSLLGLRIAARHQHSQAQAELRDTLHPGQFADQARRIRAVGAFDLVHVGVDTGHEIARRAL